MQYSHIDRLKSDAKHAYECAVLATAEYQCAIREVEEYARIPFMSGVPLNNAHNEHVRLEMVKDKAKDEADAASREWCSIQARLDAALSKHFDATDLSLVRSPCATTSNVEPVKRSADADRMMSPMKTMSPASEFSARFAAKHNGKRKAEGELAPLRRVKVVRITSRNFSSSDDDTESCSDGDYDFPLLRLASRMNARAAAPASESTSSSSSTEDDDDDDHGLVAGPVEVKTEESTEAVAKTRLQDLEERAAAAVAKSKESDASLARMEIKIQTDDLFCTEFACTCNRMQLSGLSRRLVCSLKEVRVACDNVTTERHRLEVQKLNDDNKRLDNQRASLIDTVRDQLKEIEDLKHRNLKLAGENDSLWDDMHSRGIKHDVDRMRIAYGPQTDEEQETLARVIAEKQKERDIAKRILDEYEVQHAKYPHLANLVSSQTTKVYDAERELDLAKGKLTEPRLEYPLCDDSKRFVQTIATLTHKLHEHREKINRPYTEDDPSVFDRLLYDVHQDLGVACDATDMAQVAGPAMEAAAAPDVAAAAVAAPEVVDYDYD